MKKNVLLHSLNASPCNELKLDELSQRLEMLVLSSFIQDNETGGCNSDCDDACGGACDDVGCDCVCDDVGCDYACDFACDGACDGDL